MAKKPEKKEKKSVGQWAMLLLLGLLAFSLIGFGATNFGGTVSAVATVDGVAVSPRQYSAAVQTRLREISDRTGQPVSFSDAQALGIDRAVLTQLIGQAAVAAEGARTGFSIPDTRVAARVQAVPAFQGGNGFSPEVYRDTLRRNGMTPTEFERTVREEEVAALVQRAVVLGANGADWTDLVATWAAERRDVTWAVVPDDLLEGGIAPPTEAELAEWYDSNAETFRRPPEKVLTGWAIRPADEAAAFAPTEDEIRRAYEDRAAEFRIPERRMVERLVFRTEADAAAALDRLADGTSFDDLVAERGLAPSDADLGEVTEASLGAAGPAVFALDGPGVAGPAETPLGPALFNVSAILNGREMPFEDVRPRLARELGTLEAARDIDARFGEFDDELAGGATLEDLAERGGRLRQFTYAEGEASPGTDPALLAAADAAAEGDFPELIRLADGGLAALRVDEAREARLPDLAEVRDAATDALMAERRTAALRVQGESLAARIADGASFEEVGLIPRVAEALERGAAVEGAPVGFADAAFAAEEGETSLRAGGGRVAVFRVDAVRGANEDDPRLGALRAALEAQATQGVARDTLDAFVRALVDRSDIDIDQSAVAAVNARFP